MSIEFYIPKSKIKATILKLKEYIDDDEIAQDLQKGIYDSAETYCRINCINSIFYESIYSDKCKHILYNLSGNIKHNNLIDKIFDGVIDPYHLSFMEPHEIQPECWEKEIKKKETIENETKNMATTDKYPCKKCGEKKARVYSLQTRSADEPMTTYIKCQVCGHVLKQ
jgi:DNA-directed RNA polymerase subunit M/transcription elongation factor TFIIS